MEGCSGCYRVSGVSLHPAEQRVHEDQYQTSTSYVNTGAKAGTTYYYKIVAVKGTAASDFSNIVSARPGK